MGKVRNFKQQPPPQQQQPSSPQKQQKQHQLTMLLVNNNVTTPVLCLDHSTVSDNCDSKNIKNLNILRLNKVIENGMIKIVNIPADINSIPEVLPQKSKKRSMEYPDASFVAMKSARIERSQPSDPIVITVPDSAQMAESSTPLSLTINNEFIMIDDMNHGPDHFKCYLCNLNIVPSRRAIIHHMKLSHKITNLVFVTVRPNLTDWNKDEHKDMHKDMHKDDHKKQKNNVNCKEISCDKRMEKQPNNTKYNLVNSLMPRQNKHNSTSLKRKRSSDFGNQEGRPLKIKPIIKEKIKNLYFSPNTIESIPKSHIFSDPISCSLCTYKTKVRSNLVIHLNAHEKGLDYTTKEIVNPVLSIGKSELMSDKMINLSASSFDAMKTEEMKKTELDKNNVEVATNDRGRSKVPSIVPQWICNICSTGLRYTENEITSHILKAHKISNMFKCPMCKFENKDDNASIFKEHYKSEHPSVAVQCLRVFEMITDKEEWHKPLRDAENYLEQIALDSIDTKIVPPNCRGIPIESTSLTMINKCRGTPNKQKMIKDIFNTNDKLGGISSNGRHFVCPKCEVFKTINVELFREHLYKEVNYKTWKCLKCFKISDSSKKMAWHVKKHGVGNAYIKIEDEDKLRWVDRVIEHQHLLLTAFKQEKQRNVI